ncbi:MULTISPECIES: cell division protein ZipA C-terminal FtsZ-binding domain-containing protein [Thiorhodovibrio]|uniref:cell division protein ZipA C-terminal FtsZ-binding domain-containing protein n=1 Tax=Thiorhodovibrio TaxID=61593 RepID=UPI00191256AE|nr:MULTISPECIES: cell division protein ZipA C-terminal FtsZ-binding domain-containing protein [Thiorhodovibrio]MBK5967808.1 hypothetical protein [Thiorhodovibrio winogradskyi]WPL14386.1 Cell division protein ZipA [Thiorhodovibrio litoralis]
MDAATLRIILLVIGIAFLIALFLWENRRKPREDSEGAAVSRASLAGKREPNLGLEEDEEEALPYRSAEDDADVYEEPLSSDIDPNDLVGILTDTDEAPIVQVFVVAREGELSGRDILAAASRHLLIPGGKDIFHRFDGDPTHPRTLFSMANLVQPGSFPLQPDPNTGMEEFSTLGIAMFTALHGRRQDIEAVDTMLTTAKSLARELEAEVEDADHRPISVKRIESLRSLVITHAAAGRDRIARESP